MSVSIGVAVSYSSVTVSAMARVSGEHSHSVCQGGSSGNLSAPISTLCTLSQKEALIICLTNMHTEHSPAKSSLPPTNPLLFVQFC